MAEDIDVANAAERSVLDRLQMRDEEGQIRHEFVDEITRAIEAADRPLLCEVVAELHEADLGDLIGALEPDNRVKLVASAAAEPDQLYRATEGEEAFAFKRTVSRLIEMRSEEWLALAHGRGGAAVAGASP